MHYREYPLPPSLQPHVRCFWVLEAPAAIEASSGFPASSGSVGSSAEETVLPDGCTELIVHYGHRYRVREASSEPGGAPVAPRVQSFAVVGGPIQRAIRLEPTGATGIVAARFEPHGAAAFLRDSASRFTDRIVDLESVCPIESRELIERVQSGGSGVERVAALRRFLEDRIAKRVGARRSDRASRRAASDPNVVYAIARLDASAGAVALPELHEALGVSRRTLERRFAEVVGLSPKAYARIKRLQAAVRAVEEDPGGSLAAAAIGAGYCDQPHFCREFQAIAGLSPTQYFGSKHEMGSSFAGS